MQAMPRSQGQELDQSLDFTALPGIIWNKMRTNPNSETAQESNPQRDDFFRICIWFDDRIHQLPHMTNF
jgi:hypothetical protein